MALSKEQAKAFYDKAVEAGYSDDEIVSELKKRNGAPAAVETPAVAEPEGVKVPIQDPNKDLEGLMSGNAIERFLGGANRSVTGLDRGARKLISQMTGNEEGARKYEDQEQQARDIMEQYDPKGSGFSGADAGKLIADVLGARAMGGGTRSLLAGTVAGAGFGALQPTTEGESQGLNAALGAGGAATGQLVAKGGGKLFDAFRKMEAPDALEDFTTRALGVGRSTEKGPMYEGVTNAVEAERDRLAQEFARRYGNVEGAATQPVTMQATSRLSDEALSLPEEVMNSLNPGAQRVMSALRRGSTKTSPIVDTAGENIVSPRNVSFVDVRDTVRQLRKAKRAMPHTDAGVARGQQIDNLIERLDQDLSTWGRPSGMGPGNADILRGARQTDADYASQVAPFDSRDTVIGQLRRGMGDEGAIDRLFLGDNKGQAMDELLSRVPQAREDARALYGSKLLRERGDTSAIRQLEGGTTAEQLLTPQERAYTNALAANIRENKGGSNLDVGRLIRSLLHAPVVESVGGRAVDRGLTGILPYGRKEADTTMIQQLLRAYGAAQSGE